MAYQVKNKEGNLASRRETTRSKIAFTLIIIFGIILGSVLIIVLFGKGNADDFNPVVSPLTGLLGVVIGHYFTNEKSE